MALRVRAAESGTWILLWTGQSVSIFVRVRGLLPCAPSTGTADVISSTGKAAVHAKRAIICSAEVLTNRA